MLIGPIVVGTTVVLLVVLAVITRADHRVVIACAMAVLAGVIVTSVLGLDDVANALAYVAYAQAAFGVALALIAAVREARSRRSRSSR
jgi:hypothetical protein